VIQALAATERLYLVRAGLGRKVSGERLFRMSSERDSGRFDVCGT
jgi:hypothetical protein